MLRRLRFWWHSRKLDSEDAKVRSRAATALGSVGDPRGVNLLVAKLRDKETKVRVSCAQALGMLGDSRAAVPLIRALQDGSESVRKAAMLALGMLGDPQAIGPLIEMLGHHEGTVRRTAAIALALLGETTWSEWVQGGEDDFSRLGHSGDARAVAPLAVALESRTSIVSAVSELLDRANDSGPGSSLMTRELRKFMGVLAVDPHVLERLGQELSRAASTPQESLEHMQEGVMRTLLAEREVVERLVQAMARAAATSRVVVAALAATRAPRALEPLLSALSRCNPGVFSPAFSALCRTGHTGGIDPPSYKELERQVQETYEAAVEAIALLGPQVVDALAEELTGGEGDRYRLAGVARALGRIGETRAIGALLPALERKHDEEVRAAAAEALGLLGDTRAVEPLIETALDGWAGWRAHTAAAIALGQLRDPRAVEPLIQLLPSKYVDTEAVVVALASLGDPRAVGPLMALLDEGRFTNAIIDALGRLGDKRAVEALIPLLDREYDKEVVVQALGRLGDPRAVGALIPILGHKWESVRRAAIDALVMLGQCAQDGLTKAQNSPDARVREGARAALEELGG